MFYLKQPTILHPKGQTETIPKVIATKLKTALILPLPLFQRFNLQPSKTLTYQMASILSVHFACICTCTAYK